MKKIIKFFSVIFITAFLFVSNGCDEFETLLLNIPMTWQFSMSGATLSDEGSVCLNDEQLYQDYQENITSITLVRVIIRFEQIIPAGLTGDINLTLLNGQGFTLYDNTFTGFNPGVYQIPNDPYEIVFTADELQAINDYLSGLNNLCFTGMISATNVSPVASDYTLTGYVDFLFEAETEF